MIVPLQARLDPVSALYTGYGTKCPTIEKVCPEAVDDNLVDLVAVVKHDRFPPNMVF